MLRNVFLQALYLFHKFIIDVIAAFSPCIKLSIYFAQNLSSRMRKMRKISIDLGHKVSIILDVAYLFMIERFIDNNLCFFGIDLQQHFLFLTYVLLQFLLILGMHCFV